MSVRVAVAVALALAGCGHVGFDPNRSGTTDGSSGDGGGGGGGGGGDASDVAFPALGGQTDNFESTTLSGIWNPYADAPSTYGVAGGQLQLQLGANASGVYVGVLTSGTDDLREHAATIEAVTSTPSTNCGCYLEVTDGTHSVDLVENSGELEARVDNSPFMSIAYVPAVHVWWQMFDHAGTTTWQTSPDGHTWTVLATMPTMGFESTVHVNLGGGADNASAAPGTCVFDNFNLPP